MIMPANYDVPAIKARRKEAEAPRRWDRRTARMIMLMPSAAITLHSRTREMPTARIIVYNDLLIIQRADASPKKREDARREVDLSG